MDRHDIAADDWTAHGSTRRLNDWLSVLLVGVVAAAPIPAGSNRPVLWLGWAVLLGVVAAAYFFGRARAGTRGGGAPALVVSKMPELPAVALMFLAFAAAQAFWPTVTGMASVAPGATLTGAVRVSASLLFFVLMTETARRQSRARRMALWLFLAVVLQAIWALASLQLLGDQFFWGAKDSYRGMATGTFVNRNALAMFLGMGAVLGLALILGQRKGARSGSAPDPDRMLAALLSVCLLIILLALFATRSRMGVAATGAGLLITLLLCAQTRAARLRALLSAAVIVVLLVAVAGEGLVDRLLRLEGDGLSRRALYAQVAAMIASRPFAGHGLDTFPVAFQLYHTPPVSVDLVWNQAHSTYLGLWSEMGLLIGSVPPLLGCLAGLRLWRGVRRGGDDAGLMAAALGALVVVGLHSTVDFGMEIQANMFLLLSLVALGLAGTAQRGRA